MPPDEPTIAAPAASDPAPAPAAAPAVAAEPVVAAPVAAPAAAPAPASAPAAPEPAAPAPSAPTTAHDIPTLLETATAKAPEGDKPAGEAAAEPAAAPAAEAPAFAYEPFSLPEGITADAERMGVYTALLAEQKVPQATAQKLLDLHVATMQQFAEASAAEQQHAFTETRQNWAMAIRGDPELGGSGYQTTVHAVAEMRDLLVAPEHRKEFDDFLRTTGAGDHPALWRLLNNAAKRFREPATPDFAPTPPPDRGAAPRGGRGSFAAAVYDHPSSQRAQGR